MKFAQIKKISLLFLTLAITAPSQPIRADVKSASITLASIMFAHALWSHLRAFPVDGKNHYNISTLKKAVRHVMCGTDVKQNMKIIREQLYYLYYEGIVGHTSRIGSPRFNDKTGLHEIPYVESRGLFGFVSDQIDPIKKTFDFLGQACAFYVVLDKGVETYQNLRKESPNSNAAMKDFATKNAAKKS